MGTTNRVSIELKPRPQTIAVATGPQISEEPPSPAANENNPAIVVITVITIGTTLLRPAYKVACFKLIPEVSRSFAALIRTIAEFTAIPDNATTPYKVYKDNGLPVTNKPKTTPVNASGTVTKISNGWP